MRYAVAAWLLVAAGGFAVLWSLVDFRFDVGGFAGIPGLVGFATAALVYSAPVLILGIVLMILSRVRSGQAT